MPESHVWRLEPVKLTRWSPRKVQLTCAYAKKKELKRNLAPFAHRAMNVLAQQAEGTL